MRGTRAIHLACILAAICLTILACLTQSQAAASWQVTVTGGWTPILDGNLASFAGEWADATGITLLSKSPPHRYQAWFKHDGRFLWLACQVEDPYNEPLDRAIFLLDTDYDATGSPWPDDRRLQISRNGQSSLRQGNGQAWSSSLPAWESRSLDYQSGWSIEVRTPLSEVGVATGSSGFMAGQSKIIGMACEYYDVASSNQTAVGSWPAAGLAESSPSTWGSLLLQGASVTTYTHTTTAVYVSTTQTTDWFTITQTISQASTITITSSHTTTIDLTTTTKSIQLIKTTSFVTERSTSLVRENTTKTAVSTIWTTATVTSWDVPPWVSLMSLSLAVAVASLAMLRIRRVKNP